MSKSFKVSIKGDKWTVFLKALEDFNEEHADSDADAITLPHLKEMHFHPGSITVDCVRHEVFHAYFHYLNLHNVDEIAIKTIEEIMAGFFENELANLRKTSNLVFRKLNKLKENK
jgi:hypothetical protein